MVKAKGSYGNGAGEERSLLITPIVGLREYAEALEAGGQPKPRRLHQRPDGQFVTEVLPQGYGSCVLAYLMSETLRVAKIASTLCTLITSCNVSATGQIFGIWNAIYVSKSHLSCRLEALFFGGYRVGNSSLRSWKLRAEHQEMAESPVSKSQHNIHAKALHNLTPLLHRERFGLRKGRSLLRSGITELRLPPYAYIVIVLQFSNWSMMHPCSRCPLF